MSPTIESGLKPVIAEPYGQPPVASGPLGVDRAGHVAADIIEVQRPGQFVADAIITDCSRPSDGKGVGVNFSPDTAVRLPVTVEVVADGVQLLQVGDLNEAVAVGIILPVGRLRVGDAYSHH